MISSSVSLASKQAPVQLQLEVFVYTLHPYSCHAVEQHFGVGEGLAMLLSNLYTADNNMSIIL